MNTIEQISRKIGKKAFRRKIFRVFFVGILAANLIGYQLVLPFSFPHFVVASAQEQEDLEQADQKEELDEDEEKKEQEGEDEKKKEEDLKKEAEEKERQENEEKEMLKNEVDLGGELEGSEEKGNEDVGGEEGTGSGEEVIENENNLLMENEVASDSDTGNNAEGVLDDIEATEVSTGDEEGDELSLLQNDGGLDMENFPAEEGSLSTENDEEILKKESQGDQEVIDEKGGLAVPGEGDGLLQASEGSQPEELRGDEDDDISSTTTDDNEENLVLEPNEEGSGEDVGEGDFVETKSGGALYVSEGGSSEIQTGDAIANADIVNEANQNIVGVNWINTVINLYGSVSGDVDLSSMFLELIQNMLEAETQASGGDLTVSNLNQAEIENLAVANANTGGNVVQSEEGDATVETGDASASANIVNIVNKNIVGNNWIFAVINVFGHWTGNLIVPGEDLASFPFLDQYGNVSVSNNNSATVSNLAQAQAETGGNAAFSEKNDSSVSTGDAVSTANVTTIANTNITQNNWFYLAVNSAGQWVGSVLNWQGEEGGNVFQYFFTSSQTNQTGNSLVVENDNQANIDNTALSFANTGGNSALAGSGSTQISTGDAWAFSNIFNLVNTNIVGNNWFFGIVNVMGAWEGDVEFAYPDLEISIDNGKEDAFSGETLEYVVSYKNKGKAPAEESQVRFSLSGEAQFSGGGSGLKISGEGYVWDAGTVLPGQAGSFAVKAKIADPLQEESSEVLVIAEIQTETTENEKGNNMATDRTKANNKQVQGSPNENEDGGEQMFFGQDQDRKKFDPQIEVSRFRTISDPVAGGEVVYNAIVVKNSGEGPLFDVSVSDKMSDGAGGEVVKFSWPLGDLAEGEEVLVEYQLQVNQSASPGIYEFSANAKGEDPYKNEVKSGRALLAMNVFQLGGGYLEENPIAFGQQAPFEFLPSVQAATDEGAILSAGSTCLPLPYWIWISALASYGLMVNWSLFSWQENPLKKKIGKVRGFAIPFAGTLAVAGFWLAYRCETNMWFIISAFLILLVHLIIKKNSQGKMSEVFGEEVKIVRS